MSLEAIVWALKVAKLDDPIAKLVLIGLADHANDDGSAAWPSHATLAEYANVSVRTVIRKIQVLEELGFVRAGDQELVSHYPSNRRPRVWNLALLRGDRLSPQDPSTGDTLSPQERTRGDTRVEPGVTAVSYKPSFKPSLTTEPSLRSGSTRVRATRLTPDWMPTPEDIAQMRQECPTVNLQAEHLKFIDYWCSKSGKDATKTDWVRTWRNWIRNARPTNGHSGDRRQQHTDALFAQAERWAADHDRKAIT